MHSFVAYIDESGDDGLSKFRGGSQGGGASNFLAICACLLRMSNDLEAVQWRDEIRTGSGRSAKGKSIHFADFNHSQKRFACQILAQKPIRFTAAISHKPSIPSGHFKTKNSLYFYLTRYVIERISWFCRDMRPSVQEGDGRVKIVFSRRGGMSYEAFRSYLVLLKSDVENTVHWPVIDIDAIDAQDHSRRAGLQLADCGARAIAEGFEPDRYGNIESQYLELLLPRIYQRNGNFLSYGVKFLPNPTDIPFSPAQAKSLSLLK